MPPIPHRAAALALALAAAPALAAFDAGDVTGPGGFATSCVSPDGSGANVPTVDLQPIMGAAGRCQSLRFDDLDAAVTAIDQGKPPGRADASAWLGGIELGARIETRPTDGRPRSAASAGFADLMVIERPGDAGKPGHLVFGIGVRGMLEAAGTGGGARLRLQVQADDQDLAFGPGFDPGTGSAPVTQSIFWGAFHDSPSGRTTLALDETVFFSVPFVFGQAVEIGVWASVLTDTDYAGDSSESLADFRPGLRWMGVQGAWIDRTTFSTELSIKSGSGLDWMQPVPEPPTALLGLAGALALARRLRTRPRHLAD